jgi:nucleoside-diphosphate-sugar epimerase
MIEGPINIRSANLGQEEEMEAIVRGARPEALVHLAWYTTPGKFWSAPENVSCLEQSLQLVRIVRRHGCRRILVAGSCAEYDRDHELLHEERTPCRPRTLYGASKHALHLVLETFCAESGTSLAWMRYNFIFGPGEPPGRLVPTVIEQFASGKDAPCTSGQQKRDFLHVEEVASATAAILESPFHGAVNVGSGRPASVREVVETLGRIVGGPGRPLFGALPTPADEPVVFVPDTERLNRTIGWKPRWPLEEGLDRYWRRWKTPS